MSFTIEQIKELVESYTAAEKSNVEEEKPDTVVDSVKSNILEVAGADWWQDRLQKIWSMDWNKTDVLKKELDILQARAIIIFEGC